MIRLSNNLRRVVSEEPSVRIRHTGYFYRKVLTFDTNINFGGLHPYEYKEEL